MENTLRLPSKDASILRNYTGNPLCQSNHQKITVVSFTTYEVNTKHENTGCEMYAFTEGTNSFRFPTALVLAFLRLETHSDQQGEQIVPTSQKVMYFIPNFHAIDLE
jgi:hypothetical protein